MHEKEKNEETLGIDFLNEVLKFCLKNIIWILIISMVCGGAAFGLTKKFVPEKFVSQLKLYASANYLTEDIASANTEFTYTKSIVETYNAVLQTNDYFDIVSKDIEGVSRADVINSVGMSVIEDTNLLKITITTDSADLSLKIADAIAKTAGQFIGDIDENAIIKVVETPEKATKASAPNILLYTLIGALVGAFIGIAIGLLREITDTKLRSEDQLKERYDFPILSSIPEFTQQ